MSHDRAWDETTPTSSEKAGLWYEHLNQLKEDIAQRMAVDHHWDESISDTDPNQDGVHKKVTLSNTLVSPVSNCGILHVRDQQYGSLWVPELFYMDENGNDIKITKNGKLAYLKDQSANYIVFEGGYDGKDFCLEWQMKSASVTRVFFLHEFVNPGVVLTAISPTGGDLRLVEKSGTDFTFTASNLTGNFFYMAMGELV